MLYHLLYQLSDIFSGFNVFRYITFRAACAAVTALLLSFLLGPWFIRQLQKFKVGQSIRKDGPQSHLIKEGRPTMGGLLLLISIVVPTLLWADLTNLQTLLMISVTLLMGLLGFIDDYLLVVRNKPKGLMGRFKMVVQLLVGLGVGLAIRHFELYGDTTGQSAVPFMKDTFITFGILYVPFVAMVITGSSNAVNLSDGMDGLAIGMVIPPAAAFGFLAYISGHYGFSEYLNISFLSGAGELTIFCSAFVGAALGFLWFNAPPAQVFMGDTGSLALGGALGTMAVLIQRELLLVIVGGLFVVEVFSVMIQVVSFKLRGKRVFRMAPLHHHFELGNLSESKVVIRFWIISILLALMTLATIKLQ